MSPVALALVLASALLHVFWNTLVKGCADKLSFAWLTTVAGNAVLLPVLAVWRTFEGGAPLAGVGGEVILWAAVSGLFEALYVAWLFRAYAEADLSVVYPVSRGAAPVFTLAVAGVLVGDSLLPGQMAAVGVVVAGTLLVGISARSDCALPRQGRLTSRGVALALATGLAIAGYHLADRKAMSLSPMPDALDYLCLMHLFMSLFVTLWAWRLRPNWRGLALEWTRNRRDVVLVAVFTPLSYFLIVLALRHGNVVLITAARNVGILFSTIAGALVLRERITHARGWGSGIIMAGLAGMAFLHA
jgi:drug/metabolite transporter (DMT)-like permease